MDIAKILEAAKGIMGGMSGAASAKKKEDEAPQFKTDAPVLGGVADAIPANGGGDDPGNGFINLKDSAQGLKSGQFQKDHIVNLIKAAKAAKVDPNQLLALDWQESNFGGSAKERAEQKIKEAKVADIKSEKGRTWRDRSKLNVGQVQDVENPKELGELAAKSGVDSKYLAPALALRDKLAYAKQLGFTDEALQLQAYNGYGKLNVGDQKYYGQKVPGGILDMRKNPLYGKRLLELKKDISGNKDIQALLNQ